MMKLKTKFNNKKTKKQLESTWINLSNLGYEKNYKDKFSILKDVIKKNSIKKKKSKIQDTCHEVMITL